jgi:hypothetical protein
MTAPNRQHGVTVERRERQCESKNRYPDELTARASGLYHQDRNKLGDLWVYPCKLCRGWHLTSLDNGLARKV